ncbi:MAG TPA: efflux RND transporter periplasmic adaptor subunit [Burkholderiaceae bacterium]|nr:efflux RND transporter periplasmic adaptor subunit [Burkholderiaceae bacterium]
MIPPFRPAAAALVAALALAACGRDAGPAAAGAPASAPAPATSSAPTPAASPAPAAGAKPARPALVVTVAVPERAELSDALVAHGSIAAWQEASVGAEVAGLRIAEVRADVGAAVRRGDVLATFADATVRADVAAAEAALAEARASVGEAQASAAAAQADAERARQVEASGALSAQQIAQYMTAAQTAQARLASAQARVQSTQAQLQAQALRLRMTRVLAPDDGVISARTATVGAVVSAGQELFRLVRGNRLEWRAEVTATELGRLKPGQPVRVLPASGGEVRGTVRTIGPVVDAQSRNALVYVDLPAGGAARAGMFARGEFELGASPGLVVPQQSVVVRDGFAYVFRLDGERAVQQKVRTGRRAGERIEILEGVAPDARLVASGAGFLNDGDLVQVAAAPRAAAAQGAPR